MYVHDYMYIVIGCVIADYMYVDFSSPPLPNLLFLSQAPIIQWSILQCYSPVMWIHCVGGRLLSINNKFFSAYGSR